MDKTTLKRLKDDLYCEHKNFANFLAYIKSRSKTSSYHSKPDAEIEDDILLDIKTRSGGLDYQSIANLQCYYVSISHGLVVFNPVNVGEPYCVAVFYQPS